MWIEARLRAFAAIARQKSFSRAAAELSISQPAVSKHIALLEREVGMQLVSRSPRGAELTREGAILADYVMRAEALLAQAQRALAAIVAGEEGVLSLAASGNPGNYLVPPVLARFHNDHPAVEIDFRLGNSAEVEQAVREHRVELGIVGGASALHELESEPLLVDAIVLVGTPDLARRKLSRQDLEALTWIYREEGSATRGVADEARRQLGVRIQQSLELPSWEGIKAAVASGAGVGALSRYAIDAELKAGTLAELDVPSWSVQRIISSVRARDVPLTPPAERFLALLRESVPTAPPVRPGRSTRAPSRGRPAAR
jgi:DNA-binding transcriptional LysR family regulator